mmetsp:Transcript_12127/g.28770  ORF Transcript_12127/g.28770 Transcript_12127/m.28770 type:complete len:436 (+) Transcript_12127:162-1469(+)
MRARNSLLNLDEPANLSGIGHVPLRPKTTRKAKRQRVTVLREELSTLKDGGETALQTLENLHELAKLSHSSDRFFRDFWEANGIQTVLEFLSGRPTGRGQKAKHNFSDPRCLRTASNLIYLCIMRGPKASQVSDAFVEHKGVEMFLQANAEFVLEEGSEKGTKNQNRMGNNEMEEELVDLYKTTSALWVALGMIFCKSGNLMKKEQHMSAIDSILDTMDELGDITNTARKLNTQKENADDDGKYQSDAISSKANHHATKSLHGVYRALNYLLDHVSMTKKDIDSRKVFQRCHSVAKIPAEKITTWETMTKSKTYIVPENYKTDDATLFLNTKIFFVACFRKGLLQSRSHFEEAVPLCVETILRNSTKASKNARAQDRRHCVFDLMMVACKKVHKTTLERSGILGAIEATLLAEGTVKSSSKNKARELLKAIVATM